jgi:3-dehydroquinate synthase
MTNNKILIKTKSKTYPIYLGDEILKSAGKRIKERLPGIKKIVIIADKKIPLVFLKKLTLSLKKYKLRTYKIEANERTKSFKTANYLIEKLIQNNLSREDCVISFGGGIVSDITAFVANLTKRGIKFINIPTTLLAQVDASIGGKTAVNSSQGKNLIGTFYQPDFVLIDTSILKSLPTREMICGYGEILKHALILDRKFFFWLCKNAKNIINRKDKKALTYAIIKSCQIKAMIVARDEKEKSIRMILNFGHTFAHGLEGAKNFSKKINHGEAVLLGMMIASQLSYKKKLLSKNEFNLVKKHYLELSLPISLKGNFKKNEISKILFFMKMDKKNTNNKIKLILLSKIGKTRKLNSFNVTNNEIKKVLSESVA